MTDIKIMVGDLEVLSSGSIVVPASGPVSIELSSDDGVEFAVEFIFKVVEDKPQGARVAGDPSDESALRLEVDVVPGLTGGTAEPILVAVAEEREMYLHFAVRTSKTGTSSILNYTLYAKDLTEVVKDGATK